MPRFDRSSIHYEFSEIRDETPPHFLKKCERTLCLGDGTEKPASFEEWILEAWRVQLIQSSTHDMTM